MTIRGDLTQTQATGSMQKPLEKAVATSLGVSPALVELTSATAATTNATMSRRVNGGALTINFRVLAANAKQLASLQNKVAAADFTQSIKKETGKNLIVSSVKASMEEMYAPGAVNLALIAAIAGSVGGVLLISLIVCVVIYKRKRDEKMLPVTAIAYPVHGANLVYVDM
jgi:hypothetical protein